MAHESPWRRVDLTHRRGSHGGRVHFTLARESLRRRIALTLGMEHSSSG